MNLALASDRTDPLADVLAALGDRVAPVSLARERTLPLAAEYAELFPEGGLVRGRVLSCVGAAASSIALGLVAPAAAAGSWVAVIDVPTLGPDAASELGVPLERLVAVTTAVPADPGLVAAAGEAGERWADAVAAAADGFDLVITRVPAEVRAGPLRRIATRLQQRGVVMVVLGDPGALLCDGVLDSTQQTWSGVGAGWGHLGQRTVEVTASGRRMPGRRCRTMAVPSGRLVDPGASTADAAPQQFDAVG